MKNSLPTPEQVEALPTVVSAVVAPEWIDVNGHMNIRHYLDLGSETSVFGAESCGIDQQYRDAERASLFNVQNHLVYLSELHLGDELTGHLRIVDVGAKSTHMVALLLDKTRGAIATVYESLAIHVDLDSRRAREFPPHVRSKLEAKVREDALIQWPAPLSGAIAVRQGLREQIQAAEVRPSENQSNPLLTNPR